MTVAVMVPGRTLSTGGCEERAAGVMLERAHALDVLAASASDRPSVHAAHAGHAQGLRDAIAITLRIESHDVDAIYAVRFGALVREVQGRPVGNATGRAGVEVPDPHQAALL